MPTYDYQCKTCGHRFEYLQSISSPTLEHCPIKECIQVSEDEKGKGEVRRLVSGGAGLVFKGEGFYLTDYVRKGEKKSESSSTESKSSKGEKKDSTSGGGSSKPSDSSSESKKE